MLRATIALGFLFSAAGCASGEANGATGSECTAFEGRYSTQLSAANSVVGDGFISIEVMQGRLSWRLAGGNSPDIIGIADSIDCSPTVLSAHFEATPQHTGKLLLERKSGRMFLDMVEFYPTDGASRNYTGYVPSNVVEVTRTSS